MNNKSLSLIVLSYAFLFINISLSQENTYKRVRIDISAYGSLAKLSMIGVAIDHAHKEKQTLIADLSAEDLLLLTQHNIPYDIIISDVCKYYEKRSIDEMRMTHPRLPTTPTHFRLGAMGGFLTLSEVYQVLDSMRLLYPHLISQKDSIGTSIDGRAIYAFKIGTGSSVGKPQVLFTSLHHAREPNGMMALIYYMWWLLENYGSSAEATYLANEREQWFIPVVNPDGYFYNETIMPNGGGMWRKNRRQNSASIFGVDLNRNYGTFEFWNSPLGGSSTSPNSDTYRGISPFSEPETDAIRAFCASKEFKAAFNYHTYSNLLIYPFGYAQQETPDSLIYRRLAKDMTFQNGYSFGTDIQTVGYNTRGNSDDWMYGEQKEKPKSFAFTPEVGSINDGFWPQPSRIIPLCDENLDANKYLAWITGSYITVEKNRNRFLPINQPVDVSFTFFNKGLETSGTSIAQLFSDDSTITILHDSISITALPSQSAVENSFKLQLSSSIEVGSTIDLSVKLTQNQVEKNFTFSFIAGLPQTVFLDSAENKPFWFGGTWARTNEESFSGIFSWTDSPNTNYPPNASNLTILQDAIDLSDSTIRRAYLSYQAKWKTIEPTWDWCQVLISTNNAASWMPLRAPRMKIGSGRGVQMNSEFGYDGTETNWIEEVIDISEYKGSPQTKVGFRLLSDGLVEGDGFYFDDVKIDLLTSTGNSSTHDILIKPTQFRLEQNFPNPFNPTTVINYEITQRTNVQLVLYDLLGRKIATLVNTQQMPGRYTYTLQASTFSLSTGLYFYRLDAQGNSKTLKMILLK